MQEIDLKPLRGDGEHAKHPAEWVGKLTGFIQGLPDRYSRQVSRSAAATIGTNVIQHCLDQLLMVVKGWERTPSTSSVAGVVR